MNTKTHSTSADSMLFAAVVCFMDRLSVPKPVALVSAVF